MANAVRNGALCAVDKGARHQETSEHTTVDDCKLNNVTITQN